MEPSFEKALLVSLASLEPVLSSARCVGSLYLWHIRWVFASKLTLGAFAAVHSASSICQPHHLCTRGKPSSTWYNPLSGTLCLKFIAGLRFSPLVSHHKMEMSKTSQNVGIKEKKSTTKLALSWGNFLLTDDYQSAGGYQWEAPQWEQLQLEDAGLDEEGITKWFSYICWNILRRDYQHPGLDDKWYDSRTLILHWILAYFHSRLWAPGRSWITFYSLLYLLWSPQH